MASNVSQLFLVHLVKTENNLQRAPFFVNTLKVALSGFRNFCLKTKNAFQSAFSIMEKNTFAIWKNNGLRAQILGAALKIFAKKVPSSLYEVSHSLT